MFLGILIFVLAMEAEASTNLITKFQKVTVSKESWDLHAVAYNRSNLHSCASTAGKRYKGHVSFDFDAETKQCEIGKTPTCVRPANNADAKSVMISDYSTEFLGCFYDLTAGRSLPFMFGDNIQDLTPDLCIFECVSRGYAYAGVNRGLDCHCGHERPMDVRKVNLGICNVACPGDETKTCGRHGYQQAYLTRNDETPFWEVSQVDKNNWILTGSTPSSSDKGFEKAIDGSMSTFYRLEDVLHPWMQIDVRASQLVKTVKIVAPEPSQMTSHLEIRVGERSVMSNGNENKKFCHNKVCYRSGEKSSTADGRYMEGQCVTPLTGRYITIQSYEDIEKYLTIYEVFVTVMCQLDKQDQDVCLEPSPDLDCITEDAGKTLLATWINTIDGKKSWKTFSSSVKSSDHVPSFAVDGDHINSETNMFASAEEDAFPWIQIDFGASLLVKGMKIQGMTKCCAYKALPYLEIRIGVTDVSKTATPRKQLCSNQLCHMTGSSQKTDTTFDCISPKHGRFVTIQRYRRWHPAVYGTDWGWEMAISEVDVEILE